MISGRDDKPKVTCKENGRSLSNYLEYHNWVTSIGPELPSVRCVAFYCLFRPPVREWPALDSSKYGSVALGNQSVSELKGLGVTSRPFPKPRSAAPLLRPYVTCVSLSVALRGFEEDRLCWLLCGGLCRSYYCGLMAAMESVRRGLPIWTRLQSREREEFGWQILVAVQVACGN